LTKSVASAIANASRASASAARISARRASTRARTRRPADKHPPSRRLEPLGRPGREQGGTRVGQTEGDPVPEGLPEVIAGGLPDPAPRVRGRQLEPGGKALVQFGARVLRQRVIGGVAALPARAPRTACGRP